MITAIADRCDIPHVDARSSHLRVREWIPSRPFAVDHAMMMLFMRCLSTLNRSSTTAAVVPRDLLSLVAFFLLLQCQPILINDGATRKLLDAMSSCQESLDHMAKIWLLYLCRMVWVRVRRWVSLLL